MSETPLELAIAESLYRQFNHTLRTWLFSLIRRKVIGSRKRGSLSRFSRRVKSLLHSAWNEPVEAVVLPFPKKAVKLTVVDKEPA